MDFLPLSKGQIWVEKCQLLLQTAHTEGQVAWRQDEENNTKTKRGGDTQIKRIVMFYEILIPEISAEVAEENCNVSSWTLGGDISLSVTISANTTKE